MHLIFLLLTNYLDFVSGLFPLTDVAYGPVLYNSRMCLKHFIYQSIKTVALDILRQPTSLKENDRYRAFRDSGSYSSIF